MGEIHEVLDRMPERKEDLVKMEDILDVLTKKQKKLDEIC